MSAHLEHLILQRRGVLRRGELLAGGMTRRQVEAAVKAGTWQASGRCVLIHESAQPGLQTDTLVAAARSRMLCSPASPPRCCGRTRYGPAGGSAMRGRC